MGTFEAVADRVYVAVAEPASVNIGLVVGTEGALVVDTGSCPAQGAEIRRRAAAVAGDVPDLPGGQPQPQQRPGADGREKEEGEEIGVHGRADGGVGSLGPGSERHDGPPDGLPRA